MTLYFAVHVQHTVGVNSDEAIPLPWPFAHYNHGASEACADENRYKDKPCDTVQLHNISVSDDVSPVTADRKSEEPGMRDTCPPCLVPGVALLFFSFLVMSLTVRNILQSLRCLLSIVTIDVSSFDIQCHFKQAILAYTKHSTRQLPG